MHYGDPRDLPPITTEEFNQWQDKKGHPLFPSGTPFPGNVVATRIFVAPPNGFESHKGTSCPDFELIQQNLVVAIRGLGSEFPKDRSGARAERPGWITGFLEREFRSGPRTI